MILLICPECNQEKTTIDGFPPMCQECYDEVIQGKRKSKFYNHNKIPKH